MASIPSTGSLTATHDYYRRRLGSASSNSSCGSSEHMGEVIPHHPGLPKSTAGQWWISFFFGRTQNHPVMTTLSESSESGKINCILPQEMARKRHASEPSKPSS
ncbi:pancreatic progenitor cell differentiation and proliferation factor [Rhincodon typus]|uniref:pancreatic progenitor cell differentiation and proliferation factor n=1 Tax=Rhincodon typus TaxID=259920 RepID=UPI0009A4362B|nr:pancreatic progenitor cell differentiation and proliferation factor [Rhincodon typus]